jgi:tetratricopeptide (TPR) repeat protein
MKSRLLLLTALSFIAALLAFRLKEMNALTPSPEVSKTIKKKIVIRCGPDWEALKNWLDESDMYYSFHIIEAMASFKKASRFDPASAIIFWAMALTYGPNINDFGYRASPEALAAVGEANKLAVKASPFEKALIKAMSVRYTGDSADITRMQLNQEYTNQMKKVYEQFPNQPDAQALYADAMMLQHPWDLWNVNGTPKTWTPLIRDVLEKLLVKSPNHPGANHYYIHVMEPSPFAAKALPSAERLGKTNPGLSHVVHMPSHIYLRTGNYDKGVEVNIKAVESYKKSIPLYAPVTGADFLYIIHNLHMKTNHAMLEGNFKTAEASAFETRNSIPADYLSVPAPMGNAIQYIYLVPTLVYIRFGKWNELLQMPEPEKAQVYSNVLYRFGRGMALVNQSRFAEAKYELDQMQQLMKDSSLAIPFSPFSSALEGAVVAENLLTGAIALNEKRMSDAVIAFEKAVTTEENMIYDEPRDWLLNPKHYLGNAFLVNGDGEKAEKIFRKDLLNNNENGWALFGLYKALLQQKKNTEAGNVKARFNKAFSKADSKITAPVY